MISKILIQIKFTLFVSTFEIHRPILKMDMYGKNYTTSSGFTFRVIELCLISPPTPNNIYRKYLKF